MIKAKLFNFEDVKIYVNNKVEIEIPKNTFLVTLSGLVLRPDKDYKIENNVLTLLFVPEESDRDIVVFYEN